MLSEVLLAYGLQQNACSIQSFGIGLINETWKIGHRDESYILQRINHYVFSQPEKIAKNIEMIGNYLSQHQPAYLFVRPVKATTNETILFIEKKGYFRLFPFVKNSHTIDVANTTEESYEAAVQFSRFTKLLSGFDAENLYSTLPDFHNLSLRYEQFLQSVHYTGNERRARAADLIEFLASQRHIVETYKYILQSSSFKLRVTHHDTKISNVLFDENNKGLCVIDLDTVMSGYFISDVGDMMRTYLCRVSEEEKDFSKIEIRSGYFTAIMQGYLSQMQNELTEEEKKYFVYAGKFMIYMQALRFLTDFLNNDIYYGQKYEGHNLVRAGNQATLLQKLTEKENELQQLISQNKQTSVA